MILESRITFLENWVLVGAWTLLGLAIKGLLVATWYLLRLAMRRFSKLPVKQQGALLATGVGLLLIWSASTRPPDTPRQVAEPVVQSDSEYAASSNTDYSGSAQDAPFNGGNSMNASGDDIYVGDGQAANETQSDVTETRYEASFDCQLTVLTETELAICRNRELSDMDRTLAQIWSNLEPHRTDQLRQQREWLSQRRRCRSNFSCLNALYSTRISQLREGTLETLDEWHAIPAPAHLWPEELDAWKILPIVDYRKKNDNEQLRMESASIYALPSSSSRLLVTRIPQQEAYVVSNVLEVFGQTWCQLSGRRQGFVACALYSPAATTPAEQSPSKEGSAANSNTDADVSPNAVIENSRSPAWTTADLSDRDIKPIRPPAPSYPQRAQERGISGSCDVRFDVDTRGKPYNVVANCTDSVFKKEAERAVSRVEFAPKIINGEAVERRNVVYPLEFNIE